MPAWGRNAAPDAMAPLPRFGRRSILCAAVALAAVVATFSLVIAALELHWPDLVSNVAIAAAAAAFALVAPVLHVVGIGFGLAGLRQGDSGRGSSVVGIFLNVILLGIGGAIVYAGMSGGFQSLTAFR